MGGTATAVRYTASLGGMVWPRPVVDGRAPPCRATKNWAAAHPSTADRRLDGAAVASAPPRAGSTKDHRISGFSPGHSFLLFVAHIQGIHWQLMV